MYPFVVAHPDSQGRLYYANFPRNVKCSVKQCREAKKQRPRQGGRCFALL